MAIILCQKCPGCGSQRAIHQLLNGHLIKALQHNALAVITIPYILLGCYLSIAGDNKINRLLHRHLYEGKMVYVILGIIISFGILKNIFGTF